MTKICKFASHLPGSRPSRRVQLVNVISQWCSRIRSEVANMLMFFNDITYAKWLRLIYCVFGLPFHATFDIQHYRLIQWCFQKGRNDWEENWLIRRVRTRNYSKAKRITRILGESTKVICQQKSFHSGVSQFMESLNLYDHKFSVEYIVAIVK